MLGQDELASSTEHPSNIKQQLPRLDTCAHTMQTPKIILADLDPLFRSGAAKVLAMEHDFRVVAACGTEEMLVSALQKVEPGVVLVSRDVCEISKAVGLAGQRKCKVIAIAQRCEVPADYTGLGISGMIHRNVSATVLVDCVRKVALGEVCIQLPSHWTALPGSNLVAARVRDCLSVKELRIVSLVAQAYRNRDIADLSVLLSRW
jgi:DNA-binding NarL/FixJ family response regulator